MTRSAWRFIEDDWCGFRLFKGLSSMIGVGGYWLVVAFGASIWFDILHTAT